jgi:hypothetical protein
MNSSQSPPYPLPISRALVTAEQACSGADGAACHAAVLKLVDAIVYYLGAVAVGQYSQELYLGHAKVDPTLNRSLRNLRRLLPGQWLGWIARGLAATPNGPVQGFAAWYSEEDDRGDIARAYGAVQRIMVETLGYTGEYGPRERVSPRLLLELIDQYRVRRSKTSPEALGQAGTPAPTLDMDAQVSGALLPGLRALLASADFLTEYPLYAPKQRQLLMGVEPTTPMPPISAPADSAATLLIYPPGEAPDYTKRPNLHAERLPLFPLDPLLVYLRCPQCDGYRVAALREVVGGIASYVGLDPDCGHTII